MFWITLIALTGLAAFLVPRVLDSAQEQGYREIDGQGKPAVALPSISVAVATRFPVRPFTDEVASTEPARQAFPSGGRTPGGAATRAPGLPQRQVSTAVATPAEVREAVTSRARVVHNSSVFEAPRTTARVLGTVASGTPVRWLRTVEEGWEEILLRDGRSVYMQSSALSLSGNDSSEPVAAAGAEEGTTALSTLPGTVDSFLANLREGDLLRASTYLAPGAPPLEEPDLGSWTVLVGPQAEARVGRIEPVPGRDEEWRSVLVLDESGGAQILTTWEWDARQERWLLAGWQ